MFTLAILLIAFGSIAGLSALMLDPLPGDRSPTPPAGWNWMAYEKYILKKERILIIVSLTMISLGFAIGFNLG